MNLEFSHEVIILLVDDCHANLAVLSQFLDEEGFEVLVATSGESAIEKLNYVTPDLILLDIRMPGVDGFEVCRLFKENPQTAEIPLIFISAIDDPGEKVKGLSMGAVDYITKPLQKEEVLARIRLHLKLRSLTQKLAEQNFILEQKVSERTLELTKALNELKVIQNQLLLREKKLKHDALHDALTGLPNRNWLMNQLSLMIDLKSRLKDYRYAMLFLDLDRFKVINDSLGHLIGDELLTQVASRLQEVLENSAWVSRFGGDEFIILLDNIVNERMAERVAEKILDCLKLPFRLKESYEVFIGASIGIAMSTMGYDRPETILRDADIALYHAKQAGKARYSVFNPHMKTQVLTRLQLENDLQRALNLQEFCLHYQPIISLETGQIVGFEALVRWYRSKQQLVSPSVFIPVAEEIGLINPLGWWVLQEACQQLKTWAVEFPKLSELTMSVNLSPVQLKQVNFLGELHQILKVLEFPKSRLKLEITESSILDPNGENFKTLKHLKDLGIHLCIDDFGTGYSSLSRLHELPINTLKIDRSFVKSLESDSYHEEIVQTIIVLAHSLKMEVIAEGVETQEQVAKLKELGCELAQGFLFSPPIDANRATQLLAENRRFQEVL